MVHPPNGKNIFEESRGIWENILETTIDGQRRYKLYTKL